MPDFYPRRDSDLRVWAANFASHVSASPGDYGLTAQDAAAFAALEQAYAHWYTLAQHASMRSAVIVQMKESARAAMMAKGRELAAVVRARPGVTNEQLVLLGLRVRRKARRAVGVPEEKLRVSVRDRAMHWPTVRLEDWETGRSRKPRGVAMAVVLFAVGDRPPGRVGDWCFGMTTGDPVFGLDRLLVEAGRDAQPGERVWLMACWVNDRGERGPWSEPVGWWVWQGLPITGLGGALGRAA